MRADVGWSGAEQDFCCSGGAEWAATRGGRKRRSGDEGAENVLEREVQLK